MWQGTIDLISVTSWFQQLTAMVLKRSGFPQPAKLVRAGSGCEMAYSGSVTPAEVWVRSGAVLELTQDPRPRPHRCRSSAASAVPHLNHTSAAACHSNCPALPELAGAVPHPSRPAAVESRSSYGAGPDLARSSRSWPEFSSLVICSGPGPALSRPQ